MNRKYSFIPFALPSLGREEEEAVIRVLRSGWLTTGKEAEAFENEFKAYAGTGNALAVSSATAGLHLALEALGVKRGDRVVTTPYTFTATAEVIRYLGADPVFVDIDPSTFNMDPRLTETAVKENGIRGILPVHIGGRPAAMEEFMSLKDKYPVFVVEDAAHSFPLEVNGKYLGTKGDAGVYSFYATKTITTGEGGMVVTDSDEAAERMAVMRLHGIDRQIWNRYTSENASWNYGVVEAGYKYNMPDILAAIGREQLKKAGDFYKKRLEIAEYYCKALKGLDFLILPEISFPNAWHLFMIRIVPEKLTIDRDSFIERLKEAGIGTSVHYIPLHIMPYYKNRYGYKPEDFPNTMEVFKTVISLPIYPGLKEEDYRRVAETVAGIGKSNYRRTSGGNRIS